MKDSVDTSGTLDTALAYHQRSKHHPHRLAASAGYLDWETQPDPFRRFDHAPEIPLELHEVGEFPPYDRALTSGTIDPAPLGARSVGQLFQDALGLSAWKEIPGSRWALRVNPSSGNLHPTEGYLVALALRGLHGEPAVYHYRPHDHLLELRMELSDSTATRLFARLPPGAILIGLTTIHWREAWKYGERAFRYCQHDAGHAIAAVSIAAAGLGWDARLVEGIADTALAALLGVHVQTGVEAEHPDALVAVGPRVGESSPARGFAIDRDVVEALENGRWLGTPNVLSPDHMDWPAIDEVARATTVPGGLETHFEDVSLPSAAAPYPYGTNEPLALRRIIHQRRSAVALDGATGLVRDAFYRILSRVTPRTLQVPFTSVPWPPAVDLLLFVHRIEGLAPGLYAHVRDPQRKATLQKAMHSRFAWTRGEGCPDGLNLYFLEKGDARQAAQQTSCNQAIAADGAFAVAMIADFRHTLETYGPWFYRRLFWETGIIGQVLYLEAEASGIRGTGIGCFFDDLTHRIFGIESDHFQVLYHFTMGGAVDDPRLRTLPPYSHLDVSRRRLRT